METIHLNQCELAKRWRMSQRTLALSPKSWRNAEATIFASSSSETACGSMGKSRFFLNETFVSLLG